MCFDLVSIECFILFVIVKTREEISADGVTSTQPSS